MLLIEVASFAMWEPVLITEKSNLYTWDTVDTNRHKQG